MTKKTLIRLTESDLHNIVIDAVRNYLREGVGDNRLNDSITVFINADTQECTDNIGNATTEGLWFECELSPSRTHTNNTGIGSYEFWGQPGYDEGYDEVSVDDADVMPVRAFVIENGEENDVPLNAVDFNDELEVAVLNYADDNNLYYNDTF